MMASGAAVAGASDEQLVAAARAGSDEAFEALFRRYRDRITVHVRGMVHDHGRAEDIVQETFISALRSLRATEQAIAFRPWIYQISRNACIDHLRRVKRTEEISIDSDEFKPDFEGRISEAAPTTDFAVLQRQDLDHLRQAFGGLPDSQHEILVLRELEGLSYQEIGQRMNLTPAAVESMLSRARRSLKGQYDEITTGERCIRMRPVIAAATSGLAGKRDRRALERHVRDCRGCRQEALVMGLDELVLGAARPSRVRSAFSRAAALLPLPALFRRRPVDAEPAGGGGGAAENAHASLAHLGNFGSAIGGAGADQAASVIQKAAAVVAVVAVAGGGGYVAHEAGVPLPFQKAHESKANGPDLTGSADTLTPSADSSGRLAGEHSSSAGAAPAGGPAPAGSPAGAPIAGVPGSGAGTPPLGANGTPGTGTDAPGVGAPGATAPAGPVGPIGSPGKGGQPRNPAPLPKVVGPKPKNPTGGGSTPDQSSSGSYTVPPGLLKRDGPLPPGIQKKVDELTQPVAGALAPGNGLKKGHADPTLPLPTTP